MYQICFLLLDKRVMISVAIIGKKNKITKILSWSLYDK